MNDIKPQVKTPCAGWEVFVAVDCMSMDFFSF